MMRIYKRILELPMKDRIKWGTILGLSTVLLVCVLFVVSVFAGVFGKLPTKKELANIDNQEASEVFAVGGELLGRYYVQERSHVAYEDISPYVIEALIATEDSRFLEHEGVDYQSWLRVVFKTILLGDRSSGGGSTLSQQLVKNLYPRDVSSSMDLLAHKLKESIIATRLEDIYSKNEIITLYLNTVPFSDNTFGIKTASHKFFSCEPKDLKIEEAAVLVGMLKANYSYNPRLFPEKSQHRRNVVLEQMEKAGFISITRCNELKTKKLKLNYQVIDNNNGLATYFREHIRKELLDKLKDIEAKTGKSYNLYTDGLKIRTSIDYQLQTYAESAMKKHMTELQEIFNRHWKYKNPWTQEILDNEVQKSAHYQALLEKGLDETEMFKELNKELRIEVFTHEGTKEELLSPIDSIRHYLKFLNMGMMSMDPETGYVKTWVGGIDHRHWKIDHVKQLKRQVGSTFKPFVYATALESGIAPCKFISNESVAYEEYDNWKPANANGKDEGFYSLKGALANSVNTVSVKTILEAGVPETIDLANEMGVQINKKKMQDSPSIALGTAELSLFDLVTAYCTFANGGYKVTPQYILSIEDEDGNVLYEAPEAEKGERVISQNTAQLMQQMLKGVVERGTAQSLSSRYGLRNDLGGKTGTTQSNTDGWFMAISPNLVTGTWVGNDIPAIHFRSTALGQGAKTALPIFALYMKEINADPTFKNISYAKFPQPSEKQSELLACEDFLLEDPNDEGNVLTRIFMSNPELKYKRELQKEKRKQKREERKKNKKGLFGIFKKKDKNSDE
ncbi:transglycosylase domain-containing protein [Sediminitomix flava]|uniref:Penicillin-binding protein 1A n=1 Tax=Sediminitomix flava TaxID=379075 RepID=A0A315Z9L8_SEDFL|nr:transglycosylase domain-containing protein [Sediminitomix flava]PWJ40894.1 penicillin-binding protein 1A [Sediminitomix flava]